MCLRPQCLRGLRGSNEQIFGADKQVSGRRRRHLRSVRPCVLQSGKGRIVPLTRSANLPRPSMAGAFSVGSMLQGQCELVHTSLAQLRVTLMVGNELNSTGNEMKALAAAIALLCVSSTVLAHDIYSNLSVIGMGICVVEDRIVSQW